jgi:ribonucleotide reductase alpha subunit
MIGIGVMSFADLLIKMGYRYGDKASLGLAYEIADTLLNASVKASALLAKEYGPYPEYNSASTLGSQFFKENLSVAAQDLVRGYGLRNATLLAIAPTGSISLLLGCSNGIEPIFAEKCVRKTESLHGKPVTYEVYSSAIQEVVNNLGIKDGEPLPEYIITSMKVDPINRIQMQATWQQFIDSSISSTINLPNSATEKDIYNIYIKAWEYGLKGVTVFRKGCKREGILTTDEPQKIEVDYKAPDITFGPQDRVSVACGHFLCAVTGVGEQPLKVVNSATTGCCDANLHAIQRICSLALRSGVSPELITKQLDKVVCKACVNNPKATSKSCAAGISKVIKLYDKFYKAVGPISLDQPTKKSIDTNTELVECPECHEKSIQAAKCFTCSNCGYSRCS